MFLAQDALIIDARLLLNYQSASVEAYASVGIEAKMIRDAPYTSWLEPTYSHLQAVRDDRLADRLFANSSSAIERTALDVAHAFVERDGLVIVVSYETETALDAIIARAGLPESTMRFSLIPSDRRDDLFGHVKTTKVASWYVVYELGLTPVVKQNMIKMIGDHGVLIHAPTVTKLSQTDDHLLEVVAERWSYE